MSDVCPNCNGKGWVVSNSWECSECSGSGKILEPPTPDPAQELREAVKRFLKAKDTIDNAPPLSDERVGSIAPYFDALKDMRRLVGMEGL